jgi:hypothetical protein
VKKALQLSSINWINGLLFPIISGMLLPGFDRNKRFFRIHTLLEKTPRKPGLGCGLYKARLLRTEHSQ